MAFSPAAVKGLSDAELAEALRTVNDFKNFHFFVCEALARLLERREIAEPPVDEFS